VTSSCCADPDSTQAKTITEQLAGSAEGLRAWRRGLGGRAPVSTAPRRCGQAPFAIIIPSAHRTVNSAGPTPAEGERQPSFSA